MAKRNRRFLTVLMILVISALAFFVPGSLAEEENEYDPEALEHERQIISRAQNLLNSYGSMNSYINWAAEKQRYYETTLSEASYYKSASGYIMSYSSTLANIGISILTNSPLGAEKAAEKSLESVISAYGGVIIKEVEKGIPELSVEDFIYSEAKAGIRDIKTSTLFDITDNMVNGKFVSASDAVEFIIIHQNNKASIAAGEMAKGYYLDQINASIWDHLGTLATNVATSQICGGLKILFNGNEYTKYLTKTAAKLLVDNLGLLAAYYDNEYVREWKEAIIAINNETEDLLKYIPSSGGGGGGQFTPSYSVLFDANGGAITTTQAFFTQGQPYDYLPTTFRFGYDFLGWYDAEGNRYTEETICNQSDEMTLTARWQRKITSSGACGEHLTYTLYGDGELIIEGYGDMDSAPWIEYKNRIDTVYLPDGLTSIRHHAFQLCKYLHKICLPATCTEVGERAFSESGLTEVELVPNVTLGFCAFQSCENLTSIYIPIGVTGNKPFWGSNISKVELAENLETISDSFFSVMYSLEHITIPDSVTYIGDYAFANTSLQELKLPQNLVTLGHNFLLDSPNVKSIIVPGSVKSFIYYGSGGTFSGSSLESITFEEGITKIDNYACNELKALKHISLPSTLASIGEKAFDGSGLTEVELVPNVTLGYCAFGSCEHLTSIYIPIGVTGDRPFWCSSITKVELAEGAKKISDRMFQTMHSLDQIIIPDSVTYIGDYAFAESNLSELRLPSHIETLGHHLLLDSPNVKSIVVPGSVKNFVSASSGGTFSGSSLESITFEEGITKIGNYACYRSRALKHVFLPISLTSIGIQAFNETSLQKIVMPPNLVTIGVYAFGPSTKDIIMYAYRDSFAAKYAIDNEIDCVYLDDYDLANYADSSLILPASLVEIESEAFMNGQFACVVIPYGTEKIGSYAFAVCSSLKLIYIPESVDEIADNAFEGSPNSMAVCGKKNSVAEEFANNKGYIFFERNPESLIE